MGREVRRIPKDWVHPPDRALFDGKDLADDLARWDKEAAAWNRGEFPEYVSAENQEVSYAEWAGDRPNPDSYMPVWTPEEATHLMMYETCSEGSPISPAMETVEELARWLADTKASIFGSNSADYDTWMQIMVGRDAYLTKSPENGLSVEIL